MRDGGDASESDAVKRLALVEEEIARVVATRKEPGWAIRAGFDHSQMHYREMSREEEAHARGVSVQAVSMFGAHGV